MATVLVVEDDPMIRDVLARMLQIAKYEVITAEDGVQAVQRARDDRPDLILMDMGLPRMNGWQATACIRRTAPHRPPILALTAYAMAEDRQKCLGVGCDEYEPKPINFGRLLPKIASLLERCGPAAVSPRP